MEKKQISDQKAQIKICLYTAIARPTITYGSEIWPMTTQVKQKLRTSNIWTHIQQYNQFLAKKKCRDKRNDKNTHNDKLYKRTKAKMIRACKMERNNKARAIME